MEQIILMGLGTTFGICFIFMAVTGKKYQSYIDNLDSKEYPLCEVYVVGFVWAGTRLLSLRGKFGKDFRQQARLIYGEKYGEYYAQLHWAQAITFIHLIITFVLLLMPFTEKENALFLLLAGGMIAAAAGGYYLTSMKKELQQRADECDMELPNMISKLALLINSGMVLREAWNFTAYGAEGTLYELMQKACVEMENGKSEIDALYQFGMLSNSAVIKKFSNAMIQGIEKGNSELAQFLSSQSAEMWAYKKQLMLQKGEVAASKLLAPIGIMFAGVLLVVVSAALSGMSL